MANETIKKEFVEGVNEIFTTLFNEGKEEGDGISLFSLIREELNVYGEQENRIYNKPVILVAKVSETPTDGEQDIKKQKKSAVFTVPIKSLNDNNYTMSVEELKSLRSAIIEYGGVYYSIDKIQGKAFVENVYLLWEFYCTEEPDSFTLVVKEDEPDGNESENDG